MNKNSEIYELLDELIKFLPSEHKEGKNCLLERYKTVSERLRNEIYVVNLDLNRVFYRLNNRFDS